MMTFLGYVPHTELIVKSAINEEVDKVIKQLLKEKFIKEV